jgi:hypothetical protein
MPAEDYLVSDVNAWVAQRGGVLGMGGRRIMGLGLPLLRVLTVSELRAVLGHEFGHYHGGETRLGPFLYRTRSAIIRTIETLAGAGSILRFPFLWYGKLFLLITHAISRRQELAADRLAASTIGARPLGEGLKKVHGAGAAFPVYVRTEVIPILDAGYRPPFAEGFGRFLSESSIAKAVDEEIQSEMKTGKGDLYDTHPPLRERLAAIASLPPGDVPQPDPHAGTLLENLAELEAELFLRTFQGPNLAGLKPLEWEQVSDRVLIPRWENHLAEFGSSISGRLASALPELASKAEALGRGMSGKVVDRDDALALAGFTVGAALTLALRKAGWALLVEPGSPILARKDGRELKPFDVFPQLVEGKLAPDAWLARCSELGIPDLTL